MKNTLFTIVFASLLLTAFSYSHNPNSTDRKASAVIESKSGSNVTGDATFIQLNGKVKLVLNLKGVSPGAHGVHLHEKGDCSDDSAKSVGGHWNPAKKSHGHLGMTEQYHAGDAGNIEVSSDSTGHLEMTTSLWSIGGDSTTNIIGKALIVHAKGDDFTTQPTGNTGIRIGCGVIREIQ